MFSEHRHLSLSLNMAWSSLGLSKEAILQSVFDSNAESNHADDSNFSLEVEDWDCIDSDRDDADDANKEVALHIISFFKGTPNGFDGFA